MNRPHGMRSVSGGRRGAAGNDQEHRAPSPWIVWSWADLIWFSATPLLIVPLVAMARTRFALEDISLLVVTFGATGHHLPGMMRAYGDRQLFRRYRVRFVLAPLFLLPICILFAHRDLEGLQVMATVWGTWHGIMQVYGFVRIYDAKYRSLAPLTARLDLLTCLTWFVAAFLHSPGRVSMLLSAFYRAGGPLLPPSAFPWVKTSWDVLTAVVTVAFVANYVWQLRSGHPANPIKLFTMVMSIGFWWYTMVSINNPMLGVALFEIFHDVQYLAIVWVFNRKRVERDPNVGAFTRLVFQPRAIMMLFYVVLVLAYGYLAYKVEFVDKEGLQLTLYGAVLASGFLHFYYDGFIWKIREKSTSENLGLTDGGARSDTAWLVHGLKWGLFVLPACLLGFAQTHGTVTKLEAAQNVLATVPESALAHEELGIALAESERFDEAVTHLRRAVQLNPNKSNAFYALGNALMKIGHFELAIGHYKEALRLRPGNIKARTKLGAALHALRRFDGAIAQYTEALRIMPDYGIAHNNLAWLLATCPDSEYRDGQQAVAHARRAGEILGDVDSNLLGTRAAAYAESGQFAEAIRWQTKAVELAPAADKADQKARLALYKEGRPYRDTGE